MGFSTNEFYCCGKLTSSTIELSPNKKHTCNNNKEKKDCCESKYHFFKVQDTHISGKDIDLDNKYFFVLDLFPSEVQLISFVSPQIDLINGSHAPPVYSGIPIYISNCVFRI